MMTRLRAAITNRPAKYLPFLSAVIIGLSCWQYNLGFLVFVGLVPMVMYLQKAEHDKKLRARMIRTFWLAGLLHFMVVLFWMIQTNPITFSPVVGSTENLIKAIFFTLIVLFYSLSWLVLGFGFKKLRPFVGSKVRTVLVVVSLWVVLEFLRSYAYAIFLYDKSSSIGPHWNFGNLAFGASSTPLVFAGRIIGMYGLAVLVILINFAVFWMMKKQYKAAAILMSIVIFFVAAGCLGYKTNAPQKTVSVGYLHTNSLTTKDAYMQQLASDLDDTKDQQLYDVVVLPEHSAFFTSKNQELRRDIMQNMGHEKTVYITSDAEDPGPEGRINHLRIYNQKGEIVNEQTKNFLIPGGEYLTLWARVLLKAAGHGSLVDDFDRERALTKGWIPHHAFKTESGISIGPLVCSGSISPQLYQKLSGKDNPDILTNSASLGIFREATGYHEQVRQISRFHAVANNKPFVQSSIDSYSYAIDQNGNFLSESKQVDTAKILSANVSIQTKQTIYSKFGEVVLELVTGTLLLLAVQKIISSRRKKP